MWHPLLACEEREPGVWKLVDDRGDYGTVRIIREGDVVSYVGELHGKRVAKFARLRLAVEGVHRAYVGSHGPGGFAPNPWPVSADRSLI